MWLTIAGLSQALSYPDIPYIHLYSIPFTPGTSTLLPPLRIPDKGTCPLVGLLYFCIPEFISKFFLTFHLGNNPKCDGTGKTQGPVSETYIIGTVEQEYAFDRMELLEDQNYEVVRGGIHQSHLSLEELRQQFEQLPLKFPQLEQFSSGLKFNPFNKTRARQLA